MHNEYCSEDSSLAPNRNTIDTVIVDYERFGRWSSNLRCCESGLKYN